MIKIKNPFGLILSQKHTATKSQIFQTLPDKSSHTHQVVTMTINYWRDKMSHEKNIAIVIISLIGF